MVMSQEVASERTCEAAGRRVATFSACASPGVFNMRLLRVALVAACCADARARAVPQGGSAVVAADAGGLEQAFGAWAAAFGREYSSAARAAALAAFAANAKLAAARTASDRGSASHDVRRSPFADVTPQAFAAARLLPPVTLRAGELAESCLRNGAMDSARLLSAAAADPLPDAFDWREHGAVTRVRDQQACGSCWAFSTAQNIEGVRAAHGHPLVELSAQELVDCSAGCAPEGAYGNVCNSGCSGGWPWSAYEDIMRLGGLDAEASYPYTGVAASSCGAAEANDAAVAATISGYSCLGSDEHLLRRWLLHHGPFSVALDASGLALYAGGVYAPADCSQTALDHAVLVVGFGTDAAAGDYWIVKNSWSERWGEEGYFRIARGANACGIANAASSAVILDGGSAATA
jgi:cathepsin F